MAIRKKTNKLQEKLLQTSSNEPVGRRLFNAEETAQYLEIKASTIYKKSLREISFVKIGHALQFDVKALKCYIEQNTIGAINWKETTRVY
ncbi:hypothetical protein [Edaphobacter dinghuensis]|uniref:hypothetical protein n=1 Tax=Edaphobacter dinghuensis TaxID=1560005 RepID=UPI00166C6775|nr:hypothetical protein [Edaphobacter dinghuensis]